MGKEATSVAHGGITKIVSRRASDPQTGVLQHRTRPTHLRTLHRRRKTCHKTFRTPSLLRSYSRCCDQTTETRCPLSAVSSLSSKPRLFLSLFFKTCTRHEYINGTSFLFDTSSLWYNVNPLLPPKTSYQYI